ncbi:MAG: DNA primase [Chloroflexi bacterium RBG_16_50_9]|nr:MAG: DNA primase [Chloroflexi bacterium RBG_16_50_9]
MSAIDEVKQRTDIVEVIGQYTSLKKAGRNLTALCPFHSEKHPSFFVYPEQQSWHCFGACSTGGDVFAFVMKKEGIDFGEALRWLAQRAGVSLPSKREREGEKEEQEDLYQVNEAAALYFHNLLLNSPAAAKARAYFKGRGLSQQTIADFQLGYSLDGWEALKQYLRERGYGESTLLSAGLLVEAESGKIYDRFRGKLMFPIRDTRGRTTGFGARVKDDSLPKYTNSPQTPAFDKSGSLYGINLASSAIKRLDMAIIMEGYMDVIMAHQNSIKNTVACMGTSLTETQVHMLKKMSKNLVLALDADAAGEEAMLRSVGYENILAAEIKVVICPEGKDPDDVIKEDIKMWQQLVDGAVPVIDYTFEKSASKLDLSTARDKSLAVEKLLPVVSAIIDPVRKMHYLQKLASLVKVSTHTLEAALGRIKSAPTRRRLPEAPLVSRALRPLVSNPREEYYLVFLLQHPEFKNRTGEIIPEYFTSSENREIFTAWQETDGLASLREKIDPSIHEHLEDLVKRSLPEADSEQRYNICVNELRKQYYRDFEAKRVEVLALEAQEKGKEADIAKLKEDGFEPSNQLRIIFSKTERNWSETRRRDNG